MRLEPIIRLPTAWSAVARRFGVHLFEGALSLADMEALERGGDAWHRKHPGQLVELVVIYPSDTRMSQEERTRLAALVRRWQPQRVASATVILADGLRGAMQRSVLTGLILVVRPPHPAKVHGALPEAVDWLLPHVQRVSGGDLDRATVLGAVRELCAAFERRAG